MLVEYTITYRDNGVTVTQRIDPDDDAVTEPSAGEQAGNRPVPHDGGTIATKTSPAPTPSPGTDQSKQLGPKLEDTTKPVPGTGDSGGSGPSGETGVGGRSRSSSSGDEGGSAPGSGVHHPIVILGAVIVSGHSTRRSVAVKRPDVS